MRHLRVQCAKAGLAVLIALLASFAGGCNSSTTKVTVMVSPGQTGLALQGTAQFVASVANATDTTVIWQVNGVTGGNSTCGTITTNGLYTGPASIPAANACNGTGGTGTLPSGTTGTNACLTTSSGSTVPITDNCVLITAISNQDMKQMGTAAVGLFSGVVLTITPNGNLTAGTGETLSFIATITGTANNRVNWLVNGTQGGNSTTGTITSTTVGDGTLANAAIFTAPATIPASAVTIQAQAAADTSQTQSDQVNIVMATDPTLTGVSPLNIPAGGVLQDIYLTGSNFLSTTTVLFSGVNLSATTGGSVSAVNGAEIRARIPKTLLTTPGTFTVAAQRQNGNTTAALTINVVPVRPTVLGASPSTLPQNSATTTVVLDGGYYTPATLSEFNGHAAGTSPGAAFPRSLQAIVSGSDLTQAGLFQVAARTPDATPPRSAVNIAIRPAAAPTVSNTISGLSQPVALAVNDVTGVPVVVTQGSNSVALLDTGFTTVTGSVTVGMTPTSVAVDGIRNFALVADNGSKDVAVVDLSVPALAGALLPLTPGGGAPYAVGIDEIHGRSLVVAQNAAAAIVLDTSASPGAAPTVLGTVALVAGTKPQVAMLPELGWAIVSPGGAGTLTVVDLTRLAVVFTATVGTTTQGIAVNTETKALLLANPSSATGSILSLLDQSIATLPLAVGNAAAAANPLTNVGLYVNPGQHQAVVLDMSTPAQLATVALGSDPIAVALDAPSNRALVADDVDGTVTVIDLGATRSRAGEPQILQVSPTLAFTSLNPVQMTITGAGFSASSQIRLNESVIPTTFVNSHELTAAIPPAMLAQPVRLVVDVQNSATLVSNVYNLLVAQSVPVGNGPQGIAVDPDSDVAVVVNATDGTASVIDLSPVSPTFGTVLSTVNVGHTPAAVGIVSRVGIAAVTNSADATISVLDLSSNPVSVVSTVSVGGNPTGIGISEPLGSAIVTNSASNSVDVVPLFAGSQNPSGLAVNSLPIAAAVSPELNLAMVAEAASNSASILDISTGTPIFERRAVSIASPTGVDYDPVLQVFLVDASAANTIVAVSPITLIATSIRAGVNPTSLSYNYQDGMLLTLNTASNTLSVVDFPNTTVRDALPISGSPLYAVAIHPRLSLALVSDSANNRVLILPSPR